VKGTLASPLASLRKMSTHLDAVIRAIERIQEAQPQQGPAEAVPKGVVLAASDAASRAARAKHPRVSGVSGAQELYERGRRIISELGADDRKTAGESRRTKLTDLD
jgi:hypothetical protein